MAFSLHCYIIFPCAEDSMGIFFISFKEPHGVNCTLHWECDGTFHCFSSSQQFPCVSGTLSSQPQLRGGISLALTLHSFPHLLKTKPWLRPSQVRAGRWPSAAQTSSPHVPGCERMVWENWLLQTGVMGRGKERNVWRGLEQTGRCRKL